MAPRGWRPFDISSPLLIYVSKGEAACARITSERRTSFEEGLVPPDMAGFKPIHRYWHIA
jgi:hypothetical protein